MSAAQCLRILRIVPALLALECGPSASEPALSATKTQGAPEKGSVHPETLLQLRERLLREQDTDGDSRLTVLDQPDDAFVFFMDGLQTRLENPAELHNLLEELTLAVRQNREHIELGRVFEDPVTRLSRAIRQRFWHGLTRRIDPAHLEQILSDTKTHSERPYLYVPATDSFALKTFQEFALQRPELELQVVALRAPISAGWVKGLQGRHGLLALALSQEQTEPGGVPFVVPGGRFNELYGWDSYFHVLGLLHDGHLSLARGIVDNFIYEIEHYGKVLNANRTYYLTRSQPPFFASMVRELYEAAESSGEPLSEAWLSRARDAAEKEYAEVWSSPPRRTALCSGDVCLARYYGEGIGEPPEVEPGHFDWVYEKVTPAGEDPAEYAQRYRDGKVHNAALDLFFTHDRAMRESGHDTTYRWFDADRAQDRTADYATVDLNALLLNYETELARLSQIVPHVKFTAKHWCERAKKRASLMRTLLRDPESGIFYDYRTGPEAPERSQYVSATALYVPWASAGACGELFEMREQQQLVDAVLPQLEAPGGLYATSAASAAGFQASCQDSAASDSSFRCRQWDYPHGWAPHQIMAWRALISAGRREAAQRLAYKWLYTIIYNATRFGGTVPEKFDVKRRSHRVFAEYGNVGTDFAYITDEGFGWMNASFQIGLGLLDERMLAALKNVTSPEELIASRVLVPPAASQ